MSEPISEANQSKRRWSPSDEWKLFVLSAVSLYFELLVVRWTNAYVKNVGFFTNFLVLASFVGLGSGFLLSKRRESLLPTFPLLLLLYCGLVYVARPALTIVDPGALFWGEYIRHDDASLTMNPEVFVSVAFVLVALLFVIFGQAMGSFFARLPPLRGYAMNVGGSLLGIVAFTANSFVLAKPLVWFAVVLVALAPFWWARRSVAIAACTFGIAVLGFVTWLDRESIWSPYYRTQYICGGPTKDCFIAGNGIWGMQLRHAPWELPLYDMVHGHDGNLQKRHFEDVLVVGAGGGNDVAVALHNNVGHIDAVEINPLVVDIGRANHPEHPYSSPKVDVFIDDGRAFLRTTDHKYDLVAYALPDSTGVVSSHANMRIESYLFTVEAFRGIRAHLKPDGVFVLYNHFREHWLIDKLAHMLEEAFGEPPLVLADKEASAVIVVGPGARNLARGSSPPSAPHTYAPATDDWPFLYLKHPHIPVLYLRALSVIGFLSVAMIMLFAWIARRGDDAAGSPTLAQTFRIDGPMFFMGAAFMLLEAKSIVTFGLLFGTTWLTTAMVIGAILVMVLLAIFINQRFAMKNVWPWALALAAALALVYVVPPERLAMGNPIARYVVGAAAALSPVMFANVIFAKLLGETKETPRSLASNLVGSVFGGIAEYLSLATGYRALLPVVGLLYALAFLLVYVRNRRAARAAVALRPA